MSYVDSIIKGNQNTTKLIQELKKKSNEFPCLSKKEEMELIQKYKNDRDTLNYYLFMHNIRAVFKQAKHYMSSKIDFDILVQDGMLGLAEACNRFDINKNVKFITYAIPWINKMIFQHFYNKNKDVEDKSISLDSTVNAHSSKSDDSRGTAFDNFIEDYVDPSQKQQTTITQQLSSNEQMAICQKLYEYVENDSSLSSTEKMIFTDAFYNKEKTRDIADRYGINMQQVNTIKHKILDKLKNVLKTTYKINSFYDVYSA